MILTAPKTLDNTIKAYKLEKAFVEQYRMLYLDLPKAAIVFERLAEHYSMALLDSEGRPVLFNLFDAILTQHLTRMNKRDNIRLFMLVNQLLASAAVAFNAFTVIDTSSNENWTPMSRLGYFEWYMSRPNRNVALSVTELSIDELNDHQFTHLLEDYMCNFLRELEVA